MNKPESITIKNLESAFAGESMAHIKYRYFAKLARAAGDEETARAFEETADQEVHHAFGHLDFLKEVGDPATGFAIGNTDANLKSAVEGETYEYTQMYPGFARTAREEGFTEVAEWFETLARAEKSHAGRFQKGLDNLGSF